MDIDDLADRVRASFRRNRDERARSSRDPVCIGLFLVAVALIVIDPFSLDHEALAVAGLSLLLGARVQQLRRRDRTAGAASSPDGGPG